MNRSDLVGRVSRKAQLTKPVVDEVLDLILRILTETLASGEEVAIKNFGKFEVRDREPTVRKNPRTREEIKVPAKRAVLFRPSQNFKNEVQNHGDS